MKGTFKTLVALGFASLISFPSFSEPANLGLLKSEIQSYHDNGSYDKELGHTILKARDYIIKEAIINKRHGNPKKLAVVLDIDETSLSNYNKMVKRDFVANRKQIHKEIMTADSPAIRPMLTLYNDVMKYGVDVFFVTGRSLSELKATRSNLLRAGFKDWAGLYLRPDDYHQSSIIPFKAKARESITKRGYTIIASIGDQQSDLEGGFMQKGFKLPNPFYHLP
ncbi:MULTISPECIES: HAD family acid phosphatase [unclassified Legionella]|uniref:HAD family acid phosphatase n=1 Tax=unclassified Legionella TaxID=2622702 RepID=UPI00105476E9|nr:MULTISPECIES: HAD family acid phosphatase [unclassified Legionella]MDI9818093.1 HAD family acid phosphatase [Legionella sp. PL877]